MLTSKPLAAAVAGLLFACAGPAAAEGHVKIFSGSDYTASPAVRPGAATVESVPLTPLDDPRLAKDLSAGKPPPSAAWFAKFDGVDGSSKNNAPAVRPLRSALVGEQHLQIEMQDVIVHTFNPGGATPGKHGGPRSLSAGEGRATSALDIFVKIRDLPAESKDARPVHPAAPALQLPAPLVPQRSSVADGASNTLMLGEQRVRSAPGSAAPAVRR